MLARRSLEMAGHVLYGHWSGSPQRTTSVRVCRGNMILPAVQIITRMLCDRGHNAKFLFFSAQPYKPVSMIQLTCFLQDTTVLMVHMQRFCLKKNHNTKRLSCKYE